MNLLSPILLWSLTACDAPSPVLPGVPEQTLLDTDKSIEPASSEANNERDDGRSANPDFYRKAANVWVDVNHLGGQKWSAVRVEAKTQLGPLTSQTELPGDAGTELRFARGTVRIAEDRIYMLRVPLPEPMRRGEALETVGLPPFTGDYMILHREYRLNNERGFRRLRMMRLDRSSELVTQVEAWRWIPGEHTARR